MLEQKLDTPEKSALLSKYSNKDLNKSKRSLVKGSKPLQKFKFYLDIKNHATTTKLEEKIRELGGTVEYFLDHEVSHVISDRQICTENLLQAANSSATLRSTNESPVSSSEFPFTGRLRQKTRADAMLAKVRPQPATKIQDPLHNAKLWGIPIWTVNKVFSWLDRVAKLATSQKTKKTKVINIKEPYLKFEELNRETRPVYKTFTSWPTIDLESENAKCAFAVEIQSETLDVMLKDKKKLKVQKVEEKEQIISNDSRMTRKQRTRVSARGVKEKEEKQSFVGGYCEICRCEYQYLEDHVRTEQHLNFVKNDANFLELDNLINAGANVEAFIRLNGASGKDLGILERRSPRKLHGNWKNSLERCSGDLETDYSSSPIMRRKMPRMRNSSNSSHHLRSRGQVCTVKSDEQQELEKLEDTKEISSELYKLKRACPKTKRISADERLVADNKSYYKVEVMPSKLRSSGLSVKEVKVVQRTQTPVPEESETEEQSLVVKFKRIRQSELSILNNEAENFMFPKKDDPPISELKTDECPETTQSSINSNLSSDILSSEIENPNDEKIELLVETLNCDLENLNKRKRKRTEINYQEDTSESMSVDNFVNEIGLRRKSKKIYSELKEQFDESIKDDREVEIGSRKKKRNVGENFSNDLKRTSILIPSKECVNSDKNNGDYNIENLETEMQIEVNAEKEDSSLLFNLENLKFSFEYTPVNESWYQTFLRQDNGEEIYATTVDPEEYRSRFVLPYQLSYITPLDPKICIDEYKRQKQMILDSLKRDESSENSPASFIFGENSNSTDTTFTSLNTDGNSMDSSQSVTEKQDDSDDKPLVVKRRKRRSKLNVGSINPRKSPRQHASTLAILSSLIQQRKKRERKSHADSDLSRTSLGTIPEDSSLNVTNIKEEEPSVENEFNKFVEEIFLQELDDVSISSNCCILDDVSFVDFKHNSDVIDLIENFDKVKPRSKKSGRPSSNLKTIRRKRKKNRTGWPKKKKFPFKREPKLEDGNSSLPELEDSRLMEVLVDDENGELEMCELEPEGLIASADSTVPIIPKTEEVNVQTNVNNLNPSDINDDVELVNSEKNDSLSDIMEEISEQTLENNSIQGEINCTDDRTNVKSETEIINSVLLESINNNSFNNVNTSIKEECVSSEVTSSEVKPEKCYSVTILDCKKPILKRRRKSSSDSSAVEEVVVTQSDDNMNSCVNVALEKWETAEKALNAKVQDNQTDKLIQLQPFVKVQKMENTTIALQNANRRLRSSSSPEWKSKAKKAKVAPPTSPRSPRKLRTPRGKWYRER